MNQRQQKAQPENQNEVDGTDDPPFCGIIMPIAAMGTYEKSHWDRARLSLDEAIIQAGFRPRLVSESEDIGVIHSSIVQNLYDDPIVICDVSGKNANVMFELGMRLAFDKPTIIVKDDQTDYSFDTSPIKHIGYRADLRFDDVRSFQKQVAEAIVASVDRKKREPDYSPFLGNFGKFKIAGLDTKEIGSTEFIVDQLQGLQKEISRLSNRMLAGRSVVDDTLNQQFSDLFLAQIASSNKLDLEKPEDLQRFREQLYREFRNQNLRTEKHNLINIIKQSLNNVISTMP